jgi:acetoin utilization deacetylase AcuC-like enzyme
MPVVSTVLRKTRRTEFQEGAMETSASFKARPAPSSRSIVESIPVYFSPAMVADSESFSPSAAKPAAVVESWRRLNIPMTVMEPLPASRDDLVRAHEPAYVDGVLSGRISNGFGNRSAAIAASLPFTSGAMLCAAREALRNGCVAVAPCSGFHHASCEHGAGFCTFNGLMVAALALKAAGEADRVGILDFDNHYGDGTDHIISRLHIDWITHYSAGRAYFDSGDAGRFLAAIAGKIEAMRDCDVILYQAGADPHIDDPLGGWLTTEQLFERDRLVFQSAHALSVPVAWNLAGGYQSPLRKVLDIHDNTLRACGAEYISQRDSA